MSKTGVGFRQGFRSNSVQVMKKDISLVTNITAKTVTLGKKRREITGNEITSSMGEEVFIFKEKFDRPVARSSTLAKILKMKTTIWSQGCYRGTAARSGRLPCENPGGKKKNGTPFFSRADEEGIGNG